MSDARAPFRATMPVQTGPCRGGDACLKARVQPNALQWIVIWWSLPALYDFLRVPKHQAFMHSVASVGKLGRLSRKQQMWVLLACSQVAHWHRHCVRTMVCGATVPRCTENNFKNRRMLTCVDRSTRPIHHTRIQKFPQSLVATVPFAR